ncbi:hypothetical protein DMUE_1142 [Dictyocoela muelleri]|nr:hypothetical protein DMUE_1142 [Dictyocoela muelleri]
MKKLGFIFKKARLNDESQSTKTILKKDFKVIEFKVNKYFIRFGSSTVKYDFKEWIDREIENFKSTSRSERPGNILFDQINSFRRNKNLDFIFVVHKRKNRRYIIAINFLLIDFFKEKYGFRELNYKELIYWEVLVEMSRKVYFPLIKKNIKKKIKNRKLAD